MNTGGGCHAFLQGIFPIQGSNPGLLCLLHLQAGSLPLVPHESPPSEGQRATEIGLPMSLQHAFLIWGFNTAISTLSRLLRANLSSKVMWQLVPESLLGPSMMASSGGIRHEQWASQTRSLTQWSWKSPSSLTHGGGVEGWADSPKALREWR